MPDNLNPMSRRISGKVTSHKYLDIFSISYVVFSPNETDLDIKVNVRELYYYNIHHMYIIIMGKRKRKKCLMWCKLINKYKSKLFKVYKETLMLQGNPDSFHIYTFPDDILRSISEILSL